MIKIILNWILKNARARLYTSPSPIGKRLGGHDFPQYKDLYIILDIRASNKIIYLGYFQAT